MAIRRRRPAAKAAQAPTSRVHAVDTLEQWRSMLAKAAAAKRLVVVQLYQAQNYTCAQMRAYYRRMSVDAALKAAVFAEVEVDSAESELLVECGMRAGAAKIPCYRCFVAGEEVESYAGGIPAEVAKMVARQLAQLKGSGGGLLAKLLLAAAAAAAVAAAAAYWRFGRQQGGGQARDLGAEMRSLADRINIAQQRMRNAERAGRLKAAKNQRRILQQLQAQQAAVEQQLSKRRQPSGGGGSSSGAAPASDAEQPAQGRQQRRRRRVAWKTEEYTTDEDEPPRRYRPAVLYSDEEE